MESPLFLNWKQTAAKYGDYQQRMARLFRRSAAPPLPETPERNDLMSNSTEITRFEPVLLAALRIVAGVLFLSHGVVKLFGFPPGAAPGQQELLSVMGVGAVIELATGTLITLGLFTRAAAFIAAGEMAVAYWMFHAPHSMYPAANGGDAAILFCFVFLYIVAAGAGAFSLERLFHNSDTAGRRYVRT
jgi:putative oxidoreductase